MYIITFYSFKGGVGRTMALVNVAAELVSRGRKVLAVDFDLEAPGLETYKHLRPPKPHPGIVEYVTEYRRTNAVPNLLDYIYEAKPIGKKGGRLWVMPAGRRDPAYHTALANLNWQRLYKDQEGFLLFEDTKKGWEEELKPDYVLIDSRSGDTDVQGICTRELPDAVVLMFTPNEQNLVGLEKVCRDIRREATEGLKKEIRLHFVAANVPDLDDEDGILDRLLAKFRKRLEIPKQEKIVEIRRYESLRLLDQSVFTLDRPRTRLAESYKRLARSLIRYNLADRYAAVRFLDDYAQQDLFAEQTKMVEATLSARDEARSELWESDLPGPIAYSTIIDNWPADPLNQIAAVFLDDAEILFRAARCRQREGDFKAAVALLNRTLSVAPGMAKARYERGVGRAKLGDVSGAVDDLLDFLRTDMLSREKVLHALRTLHSIAPQEMPKALDLPVVRSLDDRTKLSEVCPLLTQSEVGLRWTIDVIHHTGVRIDSDSGRKIIPAYLHLLYLLAARRWREVIESLEPEARDDLTAVVAPFVLALAYWGERGELPEDLCRLILKYDHLLHEYDPDIGCWVYWRVGNIPEALRLLELDKKEIESKSALTFSFWSCRFVYPQQYVDECEQLRRMFQGEPLRPAFLGPSPATTQV